MSRSVAPKAMVIGCAGQDGSYLTELLVTKGYQVLGVTRPSSDPALPNLSAVRERVQVTLADFADTTRIIGLLECFDPSEVYNFASVSFGPDAWSDPARTAELGAVALARLLEAIRTTTPHARFFQASSSWVFGRPDQSPQDECTPFRPIEPYGAAKAFGNHLLHGFREKHGLHATSGIFFNHDSPRRPERFVTRKITSAVARIKHGLDDSIALGDMDARRDWGFARDYVDAAWLSLQQPTPQDFVIATGRLHSVRELAERAFGRAGLDWERHVCRDDTLVRRGGAVADLVGDASRARDVLGWTASTTFEELVDLMVDSDLDRYGNQAR